MCLPSGSRDGVQHQLAEQRRQERHVDLSRCYYPTTFRADLKKVLVDVNMVTLLALAMKKSILNKISGHYYGGRVRRRIIASGSS